MTMAIRDYAGLFVAVSVMVLLTLCVIDVAMTADRQAPDGDACGRCKGPVSPGRTSVPEAPVPPRGPSGHLLPTQGSVAVASENRRPGRGRPRSVVCPDLLDMIWWRESRRGTDPRCRRGIVGPAGERGAYQITPIFEAEVRRLGGGPIDVYDDASCRAAITRWLRYWIPRVGASTLAEAYQLFRRGPNGYRRWRRGLRAGPS